MKRHYATISSAPHRFLTPASENPGLYVTSIVLMSIPALSTILYLTGLTEYACRNPKGELITHLLTLTIFVWAYLLCLAQYLGKWGKKCAWAVALLIATDVFLAINFDAGISFTAFQLLMQTNAGESEEFLRTYVMKPSTVLCFGGILALCGIGLSQRVDKKLKDIIGRHRKAFAYCIIPLYILPFFCLPCEPEDIIYKTVRSFGYVLSVQKDINEVRRVTHSATVDSCSFSIPEIIVVIGESFNRHHSNLYGYYLDTNPRLTERYKRGELFVFTDAVSPYNFTDKAMRYMISSSRARKDESWTTEALFPTIFKKAGYKVTWFGNQGAPGGSNGWLGFSCLGFIYDKDVMAESLDRWNSKIYSYDGQLLDNTFNGADVETNSGKKQDSTAYNLTVYHLIGQHVDYKERYPEEAHYQHFAFSDIRRPDLSEDKRMTIAHFANATRYNDEVIDRICRHFADKDAILIYLSDHGDEIYDYRDHVGRSHSHDITPGMAKAQFEIPFMIWCSDLCRQKHKETVRKIAKSVDKPFMSDDLPHVLYDLAGIKSPVYHPERSILQDSYMLKERPLLSDPELIYEKIKDKE